MIHHGALIELIHQSGAQIVDWGRKKFPPPYEIIGLFATIVFLIYGWTSMVFFWKLPSWLFILKASEIAVIIAYILTSNLLESLLLLAVFLFACIVLPSRWFRDDLTVRGSIVMYAFTLWACIFALNSLIELPTRPELLLMAVGFPASIALFLLLVTRYPVVHRFVKSLSIRLTIFLYVWIPLSLLGLLVVIVRSMERILGVL